MELYQVLQDVCLLHGACVDRRRLCRLLRDFLFEFEQLLATCENLALKRCVTAAKALLRILAKGRILKHFLAWCLEVKRL